MQCSCTIDACGDYEGCGAYTQYFRTARKEHKCCECGAVIKRYERYEYFSSITEGRGSEAKTCGLCVGIRDALFVSYTFGELYSDLAEHYGVGRILPGACTAKMPPDSLKKLCDWIESFWEEDEE